MIKKADEMLGDLFFSVIFIALICFTVKCFAGEKVTKIDDYTVNIVLNNTVEKDGMKTTLIQERNFTLPELEQGKSVAEQSLESWNKKKQEAEENINIQANEQIAMWQRMIDEAVKQGVVSKNITEEGEIK